MNNILVPISIGELFDKISILEIKKEKISDPNKLKNITMELNLLQNISLKIDTNLIANNINDLRVVNSLLWDIEDKKRQKEKNKCFDEEFINLSRSVYLNNDKRAKIKHDINLLTNSIIIEEKSYD